MAYKENRIDVVEFTKLRYPGLPLAIDDMSLAFHLGIHNSTLWWLVHKADGMYRVFKIPKASGGHRVIQNPGDKLKHVQRMILVHLLHKFPFGEHVGAYVPERSIMHTAQQHVGRAVVISLDLKDFFPSVTRAMVRRFMNYAGYPHRVSSIIAQLVTYQGCLPQGAPTSGAMANLVADLNFDRHVIAALRAMDPRWVYTRYSDDMDISHPEKQPADVVAHVIHLVQQHARAAGFRLNASKTSVDTQAQQQSVLGVVVNVEPHIARFKYRRLRAIIHNCATYGFDAQAARNKMTGAEFYAHLVGKISYIRQISPETAERLADQLEAARQGRKEVFGG